MYRQAWNAALPRLLRLLPLAALLLLTLPLARLVSAQAADHTLTQADNGSTVTVSVGDTVTLRLGTDLDWSNSAMVSDPSVLRLVPLTLVRGVQGVWRAVSAGQSTLSATGKPICAQAQPCPLFSPRSRRRYSWLAHHRRHPAAR